MLETFAQDIKHIGRPFRSDQGVGPSWMFTIAAHRDALDSCLKEAELNAIREATETLWNSCLAVLYQADTQLRDMAEELYKLSNNLRRSVEYDSQRG